MDDFEFEFKVATNLEQAWVNFEPDIPLVPNADGSPNPFYVTRPDKVSQKLITELGFPFKRPPKYFFSGHRGCGKSTELHRLAVHPNILKKYIPFHFSIRDVADIGNLDYRDVLLSMGMQLFTKYTSPKKEGGYGGKLPKKMLAELQAWMGDIQEIIVRSKRLAGAETHWKLNAVFAEVGSKLQLEPATREEIRQVIEKDLTGLVDQINLIATSIQTSEKRMPLIMIDDLDKPDDEYIRKIFVDRQNIMTRPSCAIIFTTSSTLYYSKEAQSIYNADFEFLPNVKLFERGNRAGRVPEGFLTLKNYVHARMLPHLIADDALEHAAVMSGGVFRELNRLIRDSCYNAIADETDQIERRHIERAAAEVRGMYRRVLSGDELDILEEIYQTNQIEDPSEISQLLQILAVLEYSNAEKWFDVHPVLHPWLAERRGSG